MLLSRRWLTSVIKRGTGTVSAVVVHTDLPLPKNATETRVVSLQSRLCNQPDFMYVFKYYDHSFIKPVLIMKCLRVAERLPPPSPPAR